MRPVAAPGDIPQRQQILSEMKNLTQRFNGLNSNIDNQLEACMSSARP